MLRYIYLRITGSNLQIEKATDSLGLTPKFSYKSGDTCLTQLGNEIVYKEDCWQHEKSIKKGMILEKEIEEYIKFLTSKKSIIEYYKKDCSVQLGVMLYPDEYQSTIILSPEIIKLLEEINIAFYVTMSTL